jgi:hypothetical protein
MDANRALKRLLIVAVVLVGSMVAASLVSGPGDTIGPSTRPAAGAGFSHNELQRAADMTQQMSTPNANTDSQYHAGDEQLGRSQSTGYVQAVEQHQADINRMLGRGTP